MDCICCTDEVNPSNRHGAKEWIWQKLRMTRHDKKFDWPVWSWPLTVWPRIGAWHIATPWVVFELNMRRIHQIGIGHGDDSTKNFEWPVRFSDLSELQTTKRTCCEHFGFGSCVIIHPCFETFNTLRPRQDGRHFADDIFMCIFFNDNCCILIKFSLKYVHKGPIDNTPALVEIMAWRRSGDKPLSQPMMISLPTHICVTRPQCVKTTRKIRLGNQNLISLISIKLSFYILSADVSKFPIGFRGIYVLCNTFSIPWLQRRFW